MEKLLFLLIFILPFIVLPFGTSPFETPKIYFAEIGISLLLLWYLWKNPLKSLLRKEYIVVGVLGILGILHVVLSPSETLFFGNAFRMHGLFLYLLLLVFAVVSANIYLPVLSQKVIAVFLSLQLLAVIFIQGKIDYRGIGTLGEANSLAASTVFLLSLFLFTPEKSGKKWVRWLGVLMALLTVVFSGSRSGLITVGVVLLFYLIQKSSFHVAVGVISIGALMSLALPFLQTGQVFENRVTIWETAVAAGMMKPLLGWGPGNTEVALREAAMTQENVLRFEYVDHTHNLLLEYWVIGGIIGVSIFLYLCVMTLVRYYQKHEVGWFIAIFAILLMGLFNPLSVAVLVPFWFLLGLSLRRDGKKVSSLKLRKR